MGRDSLIAWTHHTFNAWIGCAKVSAGCANCYAEVDTFARRSRAGGTELWGPKAERHRTSSEYWKQPEKWNREAFAEAQRTGDFITTRRRVFCASLADVFEDRRDLDAWRADLFDLIARTPFLDWLLLTKRPECMTRLAPSTWADRWPPNVWALTTVENQEQAEIRVPELLKVPARVRGLSIEPLLGAVDLDLPRCDDHNRKFAVVDFDTSEEYCNECSANGYSGELSYGHWLDACADYEQSGINWVIAGGESGPRARPCALEWLENIVKCCRDAAVPVFVKQVGAYCVSEHRTAPVDMMGGPEGLRPEHYAPSGEVWAWRAGLKDPKGGDPATWPKALRVRQFPTP